MARRSRELEAEGRDIINLSLGEPDFNTPEPIKEAAKKAIEDNYSHYMPVNGYAELREAISKKFERDNGLAYGPEQIVVSTGAKQSIANAVLSLVDPGEEVILPAPYWVTYFEIVKMAGGIPKFLPTSVDDDYKIKAGQVREVLSDKTKLFLFSSPCNPSGSVYAPEELEALGQALQEKEELYAISDEIYELIDFKEEHASLANVPGMKERTIIVNGVSKGFAMTGWRIGYMAAPEWIAKACTKMQGQFTSGASSIAQKAAEAAVTADPELTLNMRKAFLARRDLVLEGLSGNEGMRANRPEGAFYVFPDVSAYFGARYEGGNIRNASDLSMYLLEEANVATVTGEAFGTPECLRLSYAASEEQLKKGLARIEEALSKLS
ncbi:MAG: pyridoxal phosphate-dependent aminotransferase [Flavobacteriales bacterium]